MSKKLKRLKAKSLFEKVGEIKDPRMERRKLHSLKDILVIAVCAMICVRPTHDHGSSFRVKRENINQLYANVFEIE